MKPYFVHMTTDLEEVVVLQVYANDTIEAEYTAVSMVEYGQAGTESRVVVDFFVTDI